VAVAGGGDENTLALVNNTIFDDGDAVADFDNLLLSPAGAATITQPQGGCTLLPQGGAHVGRQPMGGPLPPPPAGGGGPPPPPSHQPGGGGNVGQQPAAGDKPYSGIGSTMKKLGHTMYDTATIEAKQAIQRGINPTDATSRTLFQDFAVDVQHFCVYLAMLGGQPHVTMVHTLGVYYFINPAMSAYQGRVLAFI
jgi:hypothetical protein